MMIESITYYYLEMVKKNIQLNNLKVTIIIRKSLFIIMINLLVIFKDSDDNIFYRG